MPLGELQVLLELVQDRSSSRVDAEMLEGELEIGYVRLDLGLQKLPADQAREEEKLLVHGKHERAQSRDVGLQGIPGHAHQVFREGNTDLALRVLFLGHALEALVVCALVGPHRVDELVL